jgi:NAD(P)-dependent dehydrogenase (short-subunit alcohol dehydrogenase family)
MLTDKVVVIIGGSSGIGLATAKAVHDQGAHVVIAGRSLEKLNAAVKTIGNGVQSFVVEISDETSVRTMFDQLDHVDHVFVTASHVVLGAILDTDSADLKSTLDSRFWGSYFAAKYAAPKMTDGGSITFMSGTSTWKPSPGGAVAAASGAAVESLGRTLALELSPIRVNTISAGAIDTPLLDTFFGEKRTAVLDNLAKTLPVKRMGEPQDIAETALYLMKNKYSTGTVISVDGGILLI